MKKKSFFIVGVLIIMFFSGCDFIESFGLKYEYIEDDNGYSVVDYYGIAKKVVIPSTHRGLPVTEISSYAFENCTSLENVIIPNSVESIGDYAFSGCAALTNITIPNSVESIGHYAFCNCTSLTSAIIESDVVQIGVYAFYYPTTIYCSEKDPLESIGLGKLTVVAACPVYYEVKEVIEQKGIQYLIIDGNAVVTRYVGKDSEVEIPSTITYNNNTYNVTEIGDLAFNSREITSVIIPNSVKSIGWKVFYGCELLTIYCETESQPSGWKNSWNHDNRPVVWGYKSK